MARRGSWARWLESRSITLTPEQIRRDIFVGAFLAMLIFLALFELFRQGVLSLGSSSPWSRWFTSLFSATVASVLFGFPALLVGICIMAASRGHAVGRIVARTGWYLMFGGCIALGFVITIA